MLESFERHVSEHQQYHDSSLDSWDAVNTLRHKLQACDDTAGTGAGGGDKYTLLNKQELFKEFKVSSSL